MKHHFKYSALIVAGFILSPLSWWNDFFINIPLAYIFSFPFSLLDEQLFLPAFILGYWFSNLLGLLMLHWGGYNILFKPHAHINISHSLIFSLIYSIGMIVLVLLGWLESPTEFLAVLR